MSKLNYTIALLFLVVVSYAQRVDIDVFRIPIEYAELPDHCIRAEERNFNVSINGSSQFVDSDFLEQINIDGCEWTDSTAAIQAFVSTQRFGNGKSASSTRTDVKKNKDGKVISRTKYYKVSATNRGRGYLEVYGPDNSYSKFKKDLRKKKSKSKKSKNKKKEKKKKKSRAELKKEEKKKEMENNPFLKNVDVSDVELEGDKVVKEMKNPRTYQKSLNFDYTYTTSEYRSKKQAYDAYVSNSDDFRYKHKNKFFNDVVRTTNAKLNYLYGFPKVTKRVKFRITDSKKHPENENYINAMNAVKVIFSKMKYDEPIDKFEKELTPIIDYLITITEKYTGKKKREKKLRFSAYHNLVHIYYYLDQPDKVIEYGNAIIATDYKEILGKNYVEMGEKLKDRLNFHKLNCRHLLE